MREHVKDHWGWFIGISFLAWIYGGLCQALLKWWLDPADPWQVIRMLCEKNMTMVVGNTAALAVILVYDTIMKGEILQGVTDGKTSCALVVSALYLGTILLFLRIIL